MTLEEYETLAAKLDGRELLDFIKSNWELTELSSKLQDEKNSRVEAVLTEDMGQRIYENIMKKIEEL